MMMMMMMMMMKVMMKVMMPMTMMMIMLMMMRLSRRLPKRPRPPCASARLRWSIRGRIPTSCVFVASACLSFRGLT